jgi:hypothetical protein
MPAHLQSQHAPLPSALDHQPSPMAARPDMGDRSSSSTTITESSPRPHLGTRHHTSSSIKSDHSTRKDEGYAASARRQLTAAYNALPSIRSSSPIRDTSLASKHRNPSDPSPRVSDVLPPVPPRHGLTSYPVAAAHWATGAATGSSGGDSVAGGSGGALAGTPHNKKEETWKRRWARVRDIMKREGVMLGTWRVGTDVMDVCRNCRG